MLELSYDVPFGTFGDLEGEVADIKLFEDGRVEYNGQDISQSIAVNCLRAQEWKKQNAPVKLEETEELGARENAEQNNEAQTQDFPKEFKTLIDQVTEDQNPTQ